MYSFFLAFVIASSPVTPSPAASPAAVVPGQAELEAGLVAVKGEAWESAIASLRASIDAGYEGSEPYLLLREAYEQAYGVDGSVEKLEAAVLADTGDAVARNNLACFYMRQKRWREAQQMLLSALKLSPDDVDARFNLAFLQVQVGQNNGAIEHYEAILKRYPKHVRALSEMCFLLSERQGEPAKAAPYCERAAEAAPDDTSVLMNLGLVRMRQGDLAGASQTFNALRDRNEALGLTADTYLGYVALQQGQLDEARKRFERVLAAAPPADTGEALVGMARVEQAQQHYEQAASFYHRAWRLTGSGMLLGAMIKVYLQRYFYLVILLLLAVMGALLYRYLRVKPPTPAPVPAG